MSEESGKKQSTEKTASQVAAEVVVETRTYNAITQYVALMQSHEFNPFSKHAQPTFIRFKDRAAPDESDVQLVDAGPHALKNFLRKFDINSEVPYLGEGETPELEIWISQKDFVPKLEKLEEHVFKKNVARLAQKFSPTAAEQQERKLRKVFAAELEEEWKDKSGKGRF